MKEVLRFTLNAAMISSFLNLMRISNNSKIRQKYYCVAVAYEMKVMWRAVSTTFTFKQQRLAQYTEQRIVVVVFF